MRIWIKMVLVAVMTLVILVPLAMVNGLIGERQSYRRQAVEDVVRAYAGAQAVTGPVLTVPYTEFADVEEVLRDGRCAPCASAVRRSGPSSRPASTRTVHWCPPRASAESTKCPFSSGTAP
jgi:hypothetical protein